MPTAAWNRRSWGMRIQGDPGRTHLLPKTTVPCQMVRLWRSNMGACPQCNQWHRQWRTLLPLAFLPPKTVANLLGSFILEREPVTDLGFQLACFAFGIWLIYRFPSMLSVVTGFVIIFCLIPRSETARLSYLVMILYRQTSYFQEIFLRSRVVEWIGFWIDTELSPICHQI